MGLKIGKFLGKVVKLAEKVVLGGAISNLNEDTAENPKGKFSFLKLLKGDIWYAIAFYIFLYLLLTGKIDWEQFEQGIEAAEGLQN